ncbi:Growth factor receptor cysteine-rich domain [Trinorchestia longiramus]|nr:Growth factor receptor cysteine-rich domain [Trinorchestia longiramus]
MTRIFFYLPVAVVLCVAFWSVTSVDGLSCLECPPDECVPPTDCKYGTGRWACMCCDGCLMGPGEQCGGPWNIDGRCGTGLQCQKEEPSDFNSVGICVPDAVPSVVPAADEEESDTCS